MTHPPSATPASAKTATSAGTWFATDRNRPDFTTKSTKGHSPSAPAACPIQGNPLVLRLPYQSHHLLPLSPPPNTPLPSLITTAAHDTHSTQKTQRGRPPASVFSMQTIRNDNPLTPESIRCNRGGGAMSRPHRQNGARHNP